ncbi:MAG: hypothetical protein VB980_02480 [Opitutales bacterium]
MAKNRNKDDLQVSLFPFLSILACVLGILTLMITAVVLSQANNETFQEQVAEAMSDQTEFQEQLQREKDELVRLRKELEEVRKEPNKVIDPQKKKKLEQEIKKLKEEQSKKLQMVRQQIAKTKKEKQENVKELVVVTQAMGNVEGQLKTRKDPSKFATMVVKPSGSGLGGSLEPTFVECDGKGINVFSADGKKAYSVNRAEIAKHKKWLSLIQKLRGDAPFRNWWSTAGSTIEAKFISRKGGTIILRKKGGNELQVPSTQLKPRSIAVVRQIEAARKANRPDPVARYVIFLVRTTGIRSWQLARESCYQVAPPCKNGKIPLNGEGEIDLTMFGPS